MTAALQSHVPLFAQLAIDRIDALCDGRTGAKLDAFLDAYAATYGTECDDRTRTSAHHICERRFYNFQA